MAKKFGQFASRYTFTLPVDTHVLDSQLGCIPVVQTFSAPAPKNSTKIADLLGVDGNITSTFTFLDPTKKTKRWTITMKDFISNTMLPPQVTDCRCWNDHHTFSGAPMGCPVQFVRETMTENYYSHANKKEMEIKSYGSECYYVTVGIFCNWGCQLAFAESKKNDPFYRESISLIYKMYYENGGKGKLHASPPFTLLKAYGGPLSIEEYREKYNIDTFINTKNHYVRMVPIGELYEVQSKF